MDSTIANKPYLKKLLAINQKLSYLKEDDSTPRDDLFYKVYRLSNEHLFDIFGVDCSQCEGMSRLNALLKHKGDYCFIHNRFVSKYEEDKYAQRFSRARLEEIIDACTKMEAKMTKQNIRAYLDICSVWGKKW